MLQFPTQFQFLDFSHSYRIIQSFKSVFSKFSESRPVTLDQPKTNLSLATLQLSVVFSLPVPQQSSLSSLFFSSTVISSELSQQLPSDNTAVVHVHGHVNLNASCYLSADSTSHGGVDVPLNTNMLYCWIESGSMLDRMGVHMWRRRVLLTTTTTTSNNKNSLII